MSRRILYLLVLPLVALAVATSAHADDPKIGVVELGRLLEEAPQAAAARQRLEQQFGSRRQDLMESQRELQEREQRLEQDGDVMSPSERERLEREIQERGQQLQADVAQFRQEFQQREQQELAELQQRAYDEIVGIAQEQGFDLILSEGVIYASDHLDVTDELLERLQDPE